jgi:hypothetical protein
LRSGRRLPIVDPARPEEADVADEHIGKLNEVRRRLVDERRKLVDKASSPSNPLGFADTLDRYQRMIADIDAAIADESELRD